MGSHGPAYYRRSDAQTKPFADECASNAFDKCQTEQIVNAYDNSIAYTDQFLARTIQWLQGRAATGQPTAMMYISDHGESLGEDGLYLHGMPYLIAPEVQKKVPWDHPQSACFCRSCGIRMDCLQQQKDRAITHDYLFHSVLGMRRQNGCLPQRPRPVCRLPPIMRCNPARGAPSGRHCAHTGS